MNNNLFTNKIEKEEFICGNNIVRLCDELDIHFSKIDYWQQEIALCASLGKSVFVTHQGDMPVTQEMVNSAPPQIKFWFATNCRAESTKNCKVVGIPLGLNNVDDVICNTSRGGKYSSNFSHVAPFQENLVTARNFRVSSIEKGMAYCNFNVRTNFQERQRCLEYFLDKPYAVVESPNRTHLDYLKETLCYPFVISPPGNGDDCIRIWETLYLGKIPVVLRSPSMRFFEGLPIMFVDSWQEVTEDSLQQFYNEQEERASKGLHDLDMITLSYWRKQLLEANKETL